MCFSALCGMVFKINHLSGYPGFFLKHFPPKSTIFQTKRGHNFSICCRAVFPPNAVSILIVSVTPSTFVILHCYVY